MKTVGLDTGNNGGIAFLKGTRIINCLSMPTFSEKVGKGKNAKVRTEPDFNELIEIFREIWHFGPTLVALEQVWPMAGDSAQTAFSLGGSYKLFRGLIHTHRLPYVLVAPGAWKRHPDYARYGLWGAGDDAKTVAIEIVRDLYPTDFERCICPLRKGSTTRRNKPHDGRADAVLIARYAQSMER